MRICKTETVVRYHVQFRPGEINALRAHPRWQHRIHVSTTDRNNLCGHAWLTKSEINDVCDVLGINGREFMATAIERAA